MRNKQNGINDSTRCGDLPVRCRTKETVGVILTYFEHMYLCEHRVLSWRILILDFSVCCVRVKKNAACELQSSL